MTYELLPALIGFALASVMTPGPNNLMLMTSGANFGFRRTLPHMAGITIGFPAMVLLVGIGVMQVFDLWPTSYLILRTLSVAYLLYLAWKIANAAPPDQVESHARPMSFTAAAAFQWVNPKAWTMALSAVTIYAGNHSLAGVLVVTGVFVGASVISTSSWAAIGLQIRKFLSTPKRLRIFNLTMAALLVATLIPVLLA